jgi:hypothetical protein
LLRDRSSGTRGQRRRQERHPRFVTSVVLSDCTATVEREDAWSMRPSSILKSRADQERSPLHDVKQHAHFQASLGGAKSFHLWTSETGCCERGVPVLRTHSLSGSPRRQDLRRGLSRNGCRPEVSKPPASCALTTKPARAAERRIMMRRIMMFGS